MPLSSYIRILRPFNCIMAAIAAFIGYSIALGFISFSFPLLIGMAIVFLVCGAGQAINDYFDRDVDKKLHPDKPLPSGQISPKNALLFSLVLFLIAILLATQLPFISLVIAIVFSFLQILYSAFIQKFKVIGNGVVALGTAFTLIFGASIVGNLGVVILLALSAFFSNLGREIIKDVEDQKSDRGTKTTLPMLVSEKAVQAIVLLAYLAGIVLVYLPYYFKVFGNTAFILVVTAANIVFLYSFLQLHKKQYKKAQHLSKVAMLLALLGFLAGVLLPASVVL
jgi:geranylgeranylglycerol-phosphate geranylgeranyltransferase